MLRRNHKGATLRCQMNDKSNEEDKRLLCRLWTWVWVTALSPLNCAKLNKSVKALCLSSFLCKIGMCHNVFTTKWCKSFKKLTNRNNNKHWLRAFSVPSTWLALRASTHSTLAGINHYTVERSKLPGPGTGSLRWTGTKDLIPAQRCC